MALILKSAIVNGEKNDIKIENGIITQIGEVITKKTDNVVECFNNTLLPAFIDIHTHLREPGLEYKEDIESGAKSAVAGGYSAICCMPNTKPAVDNPLIIKHIIDRAKEVGLVNIYPVASITKGQEGKELSEMAKLMKCGAIAFSDDGVPVVDNNLMKLALEYASGIGAKIFSHSEDLVLSNGGVVNEGYNQLILGLPGINRASEEVAIARDIILAESLNTSIHIFHISTAGSVKIIEQAKQRGVRVTAETAPHYFAGTDSLIANFDTNAKVNPPLREETDRLAIIEGLKSGIIDCIATDHAPHSKTDKNTDYISASFGISGLESAFALAYSILVKGGYISISELSKLMTKNPSKIAGLDCGEIKVGGKADLTVVNLDTEYAIDSEKFYSKGKNTPFNGCRVYGKVFTTIINGKIVYDKGNHFSQNIN